LRRSVDVNEIERLINEIERGNLALDKIRAVLVARTLPVAKAKQEVSMAKIDLDSLNIEELSWLRGRTIEKLTEKVAARHAELEAEMERLSQYGESAKKSQAGAPAPKAKKRDEKKSDAHHDGHHSHHVTEPVADAA
jgi:hypothetical protein